MLLINSAGKEWGLVVEHCGTQWGFGLQNTACNNFINWEAPSKGCRLWKPSTPVQNINWKWFRHFDTWCWRRMEKISCTDRVRNEEVLTKWKEGKETNFLQTVKKMAKWIGHILCRGCLLKHIIEGKIEGMKRRGWRRRQLLDNLEENRFTAACRGSTRSHYVESSLWKRLWTCLKADCMVMTCVSCR